jgi:cyclase
MLKKRVIFTLLFDNGSFMLSRNFRLQRVGNLNWLKKNYNFSKIAFSIDELVILDVTRGKRDQANFCSQIEALTDGCFVPIAAGGGICCVKDARTLLRSGADKVVINTLMDINPNEIFEIASEFGRQCIIASIDVTRINNVLFVKTENGSKVNDFVFSKWIDKLLGLPIGELYINSIDRDGTGQGYDMSILDNLNGPLPIPIILAGGAGKYNHLADGLSDPRVDAVATAHLFNFVGDGLEKAREELIKNKFVLPIWEKTKAAELKNIIREI